MWVYQTFGVALFERSCQLNLGISCSPCISFHRFPSLGCWLMKQPFAHVHSLHWFLTGDVRCSHPVPRVFRWCSFPRSAGKECGSIPCTSFFVDGTAISPSPICNHHPVPRAFRCSMPFDASKESGSIPCIHFLVDGASISPSTRSPAFPLIRQELCRCAASLANTVIFRPHWPILDNLHLQLTPT